MMKMPCAMYVEWVCRQKWPLTAYCLNLANELSIFIITIIIITVTIIIIIRSIVTIIITITVIRILSYKKEGNLIIPTGPCCLFARYTEKLF